MAAQTPQPYEAVEPHMGTLFRIKLYAANEEQAQAGFKAAFARISQLDNELSDYKADSELNRLTREAVHHPMPVSDDLLRILSTSESLSQQTNGAFDITVGPLTHLWREARKSNQIPDDATVAAARERCGFRKLHVDVQHHTVTVDRSGMQLDAGAIAKGDAADQALRVLSEQSIRSALVAASGDLAFSDAPPGEVGWKIGLDSFDKAGSPFTRVLTLANGAVSTSGSSEQHLDAAGKRYSHIIDPVSGMGLTRDLTVSVLAGSGIEADSYATAVSVLGPDRGLAFIEAHAGTSALLLTIESGRPTIIESSRFPSRAGSDQAAHR
jgi:thiamine biosynthesis lipoprotein